MATLLTYRIGLDDGNDTLEIGAGTAHGTSRLLFQLMSAADMTIRWWI